MGATPHFLVLVIVIVIYIILLFVVLLHNFTLQWLNSTSTLLSAGLLAQATFTSMDTEACCDTVRLYDGATTTSPLLREARGSTLPAPVRATGGYLTLSFYSDQYVLLLLLLLLFVRTCLQTSACVGKQV